jgi:hypothetical protein
VGAKRRLSQLPKHPWNCEVYHRGIIQNYLNELDNVGGLC